MISDDEDGVCRHCDTPIRLLSREEDTVGVLTVSGDRPPRPGDWASPITGISCPGADIRGDGARHAPQRLDVDAPSHDLIVRVVAILGAHATALGRLQGRQAAGRINFDDPRLPGWYDITEPGDSALQPVGEHGTVPTADDEGTAPWLAAQLGNPTVLKQAVPPSGKTVFTTVLSTYQSAYERALRDELNRFTLRHTTARRTDRHETHA